MRSSGPRVDSIEARRVGVSRREALKVGAVVAGTTWVAPVVQSIPLISDAAEAASPSHRGGSRSDSSEQVTDFETERLSPRQSDISEQVSAYETQGPSGAQSRSSQGVGASSGGRPEGSRGSGGPGVPDVPPGGEVGNRPAEETAPSRARPAARPTAAPVKFVG